MDKKDTKEGLLANATDAASGSVSLKEGEVFDYRKKYGYDQYEATLNAIPDDPSGLDEMLADLKKGFHTGKTMEAAHRKDSLRRMIKGLEEMEQEFLDAMLADLGKDNFTAMLSEMTGSKVGMQHEIDGMEEHMRERSVDTPLVLAPAKSVIRPEPLGVILVMSAWNYPVNLLLVPVAQAVAAGNCVVLKPSELAPRVSNVIVKYCEKYMDRQFFRCVEGAAEVCKKLTSLRFDKIVFTGSTQKGKLVAMSAARNLVPCLLELGGKCPGIVDASASINMATQKVLMSKIPNAGQTCIAVDYVLCHESKKDAFIAKARQVIAEAYGEMREIETAGKVVNEMHYKRLCGMLADHGGEVVIGNANAHNDMYLKPTVILNPRKDAACLSEEIFGPILPVITYKDINEVIDYIRYEQEKPLAVYYFGDRGCANMEKVKKMTSSGGFVCNEAVLQVTSEYLPFGGVGESGYGRYHGVSGFEEFSNMKSCLERPTLDFAPFNTMFPPYSADQKQQIRSNMGSMYNTTQAGCCKKISICCTVFWLIIALVIAFFVLQPFAAVQAESPKDQL